MSSQRSFSTHAVLKYLNIFQMGMDRHEACHVTHFIILIISSMHVGEIVTRQFEVMFYRYCQLYDVLAEGE